MLLAASIAAPVVGADSYRVVGIHDGDNLRCLDKANVQHKIRLAGIDAPELGQPFGSRAREPLAQLAMNKSVTLEIHGKDCYQRTLATVQVDGRNVNLQMVEDGFAWHYKQYSKDRPLAVAEENARRGERGLWSDSNPVQPWEWRKSERDRRSALQKR